MKRTNKRDKTKGVIKTMKRDRAQEHGGKTGKKER